MRDQTTSSAASSLRMQIVPGPLRFTVPATSGIQRALTVGRHVLAGLMVLAVSAPVTAEEPGEAEEPAFAPEQLEFFESRIRPVLVEHCYSCHSSEAREIKGGLLLDSRAGLLAGGDSGPALVAGKPDESLILSALRHESLEMPPERRLPDRIVQDFETWIRSGAADPRSGVAPVVKGGIDLAQGRRFWPFQPVVRPAVPNAGAGWALTDPDHFLAAGHGNLMVAPDASPDVLIRRLTFVLTGLPPTLEEQRQFADAWQVDPEKAMESMVDQLMDSPRFGERWGRHWMDVVRFAESTGGGRSLMLPDAWRFRDYVIRSFQQDKPYNQLIREHLAGDLLPAANDEQADEQLTGVGYLALGAINYEEQDKEQLRMDVVDEQIDSTGRTFLGMTLGCARCHDHKFDPVPTADYYAMAGVFRSTRSLVPGNVSGFVTASLRNGYDKAALEAWTVRDQDLDRRIQELKKSVAAAGKKRGAGPGLADLSGIVVDDADAVLEGEWTTSMYQPPFLGDGYRHSGQPRRGISARYEVMLPAADEYLVRMVINHGESRSDRVPVLIVHADGETVITVSQKAAPPGDGIFAELGRFRFEAGNPAAVVVNAADADPGHVIIDAVQFIPVSMALPQPAQPGALPTAAPALPDSTQLTSELKRLEDERKTHAKAKPDVPTVMCVEDESEPGDWHIHIRGEVRNTGRVVPRGALAVATPEHQSSAFPVESLTGTSGRRELAEWIASPENPLTARVWVNRVWQAVFGEGLVRTPDNFGTTGLPPTNPELLDFLAHQFVTDDGWSTKSLIRRLCLSRAFRMSSEVPDPVAAADPENLQFTHACFRRLEAECIRDSLLRISGTLDLSVTGGRTFAQLSTYDNEYDHAKYPLTCRSVFVPSFRNTMLDLFEVFDIANPNLVTGKRTRSTRPAQALYLLNSPFVVEQAALAAKRFVESSECDQSDAAASLRAAWRICIAREPSPRELQAVLPVVAEDPTSAEAWSAVFHSLFASLEFRFLD